MRHAVIMAGGSGTRLWPLSRGARPKQLLDVVGGKSLLRLAFERLVGVVDVGRIHVCTGVVYAEAVLAAFAADGVLKRRFALPEISTAFDFPAAQAISFHFIDYVVHGWDVARFGQLPSFASLRFSVTPTPGSASSSRSSRCGRGRPRVTGQACGGSRLAKTVCRRDAIIVLDTRASLTLGAEPDVTQARERRPTSPRWGMREGAGPPETHHR